MRYAIYPEYQSAATATSEDASYPVTNLTDNDYIKKVWKAASGVNSATLTVPIAANGQAIALFGTNASSVTCVIKDNGGGVVESETHTLATSAFTYTAFWQMYTQQLTSHTAEITLTAAVGTTVEAGIVRAGDVITLVNPQYGVNEDKKDFSIRKELRNGALYTKKLEIVRKFGYSMELLRDTTLLYLKELYDYYGPDPFAMLIADGIDDNHWALFGAFESPPSISHEYFTHSNVSINILEAV
jgi:hypothetical protein